MPSLPSHDRRLLHDLAIVGNLEKPRRTAGERLEAKLGAPLVEAILRSFQAPFPAKRVEAA